MAENRVQIFYSPDDKTKTVRVKPATEEKQDNIITELQKKIYYEYMGSQESGNYKYFGFKENGGTHWKIMRQDTTDDSAWQYAYGDSGWSSAWSDPTTLTYSDPTDG